MQQHSDIEKELREISPLVAEMEKNIIFHVPPGYFEYLPGRLLAHVKTEKPADLPADEEIKQLSPLIASLKNKPTLSVPPGYFNTFSQTIDPVEKAVPVPVININRNRKWKNYAVAASIIGIMGIGISFLLHTKNKHESPLITQNGDTRVLSVQLPGVSDTDLANYLSSVPETPEWTFDNPDMELENIAFLKIDDANFSDLFNDIPDEALSRYEQDFSGAISL